MWVSEGKGRRQGDGIGAEAPEDDYRQRQQGDEAFLPTTSPLTQPYLKAVDVQDGDGECALLWGHQRIDPGDEPAEQQCIQNFGDGIPGQRWYWGGWVQ